jgi:A/G-specific adenine glycosylase
VPDTLEKLQTLPGIGSYTARAVLTFAFDRPIAPLDTNIRRVLDRAVGPLPPAAVERQSTADGLVPDGSAAAWGHALMDLGATICIARSPRCDACPIRQWCVARNSGADPWRRRGARPANPFPTTTRWLRGRILDRLRDAPDGDWVGFDEAIGTHSHGTVLAELGRMSADGLLEVRSSTGDARLVSSLEPMVGRV